MLLDFPATNNGLIINNTIIVGGNHLLGFLSLGVLSPAFQAPKSPNALYIGTSAEDRLGSAPYGGADDQADLLLGQCGRFAQIKWHAIQDPIRRIWHIRPAISP